MSISISSLGKTLGCVLVVTSCSWLPPVKAQSINDNPLVAQIVLPTPALNSGVNTLQQRADTAYTQGDAALAVNLYAQLLQQQPNSYLFQVRMAVAMLNTGPEYLSRSYEAFQKARDLNPNIDEPWIFLGRLEESLEQPAKALGSYQKAYALNPTNQDAFIGIQRLQAQVALPTIPEGLEVIEQRKLADYLEAVEPNSRLLQGLREQQSIIRSFAWRSSLPYLSLGYSWSRSSSDSPDSGAGDPCVGGRRQSTQQVCGGNGTSNGLSIGVNWNLTELFLNSNQLRLRGYEDDINKNLRELKTETQRLFTVRGTLLEEFRQLAWQAALDPSDRTIRYNRRDRYLQILYISQQIYSITGLY